MRRLILHSLRQMLDFTYLTLLFIYALLCWIMTGIAVTHKGTLSSAEILGIYKVVFLSLVVLNSIYFITGHFRETLNSSVRDILIVRLGRQKFFWGLIVSYIIYLIIFNLVPLVLTALVQDVVYNKAPGDLPLYIRSALSITVRIGFWPVLLAVILIVWIKNDLLTLISWSIVYLVVSIIRLSSKMVKVNGEYLLSDFPLIINISFSVFIFIAALRLSRRLTRYEYNEKISGGVFSFIAGIAGFDMTRFHYKMIGFKTQILYLVFGSIGFILFFTLLNGTNANNIVILKMFVAVIFPLLFSFNQYSLISIDLDSGMIVTNVMRKACYDRIVINRWISMLFPQLLFSIVFSLTLMNMIPEITFSFMLLTVLLNILFSSMNFFLSVYFQRAGYANLIAGFSAYLMLFEGIQKFFTSNSILNRLNIFGSITSFSYHIPQMSHIAACLCITGIFFILTRIRLKSELFGGNYGGR